MNEPRAKERYYVSERFSKEIPSELKEAWRIAEDNMFSLRDRQWDVREFVLSGTRIMNIPTFIGKPLMTILIQDAVGGWAVSWPAKFQDSANLNLDLTANTATVIIWQPVSDTRVLAIAGMTGIILS